MIPLNLYKPLQYIESTGTQYIDTGLLHTDLIIEYEAKTTSSASSSQIFLATSTSSNWVGWKNGHPICGSEISVDGTAFRKYRAVYNSSNIVLTDITSSQTGTTPNGSLTSTLRLFSWDGTGTFASLTQCKAMKFTNAAGTLLAYFIPAQRLSDSVVGMYDDVTGEFFDGTGSFVAGPEDYSGCALINVNGTITPSREAYINDNGTIKYCEEAYTNVNGTPTKVWQAGYPTEVSSANPVQTDVANAREIDYKIYGNTKQGELPEGPACPTPSAPLEIKGVGDRTSNLTNYVLNATVTGNGTGGGVASGVSSGVTWKENTRYTFSLDCTYSNVTYSQAGNLIFATIQYTDGSRDYIGITSVNYQQGRISFTSDANKTISSVPGLTKHVRWTGGTMTLSNWKIEEGTTATAYEPYGYKLPILQAQNCGCVDMGTLNWLKDARWTHKQYYAQIESISSSTSVYTEGYTPSAGGWSLGTVGDKLICLVSPYYVIMTDDRFDSKDDFKSAMSGKYLYYQRTTDSTWTTPTTTNLYLPKQLQKVGAYADDATSGGVLTSRVGVKVLDGTEEWQIGQSFTDGTYRTFLYMSFPSVDSATLCSHFEQGQFSDRNQANQGNKFYINTTSIQIRSTQFDSPVSAKSWLAAQYAAGTPVIIYYPLATPTTETIETPTISTVKGTNIFDVETSVKPSNKTIDYVKRCK